MTEPAATAEATALMKAVVLSEKNKNKNKNKKVDEQEDEEDAESTTDDDLIKQEADDDEARPLENLKLDRKSEVWKGGKDRSRAKQLKKVLKVMKRPSGGEDSHEEGAIIKIFLNACSQATNIQDSANRRRKLEEISNAFQDIPGSWIQLVLPSSNNSSLFQKLIEMGLPELFSRFLFLLYRNDRERGTKAVLWHLQHKNSLQQNFIHTFMLSVNGSSKSFIESSAEFWRFIQTSPYWFRNHLSSFEKAYNETDYQHKRPSSYLESVDFLLSSKFKLWAPPPLVTRNRLERVRGLAKREEADKMRRKKELDKEEEGIFGAA